MLYKDIKYFKSSLRTYLIEHAFYSINEYYQLTSQRLLSLCILLQILYLLHTLAPCTLVCCKEGFVRMLIATASFFT
jgi:hypothetical protein